MLAIALKLAAPIILIVGGMHLVLGVQADVLLGAKIGLEVLRDPVLDSQNRFYGIVFTVYGFLLFLCATDLEKYQTVLRILLWVFFAAGCARLVSIATHGLPSELVLMLLATELVLPPICILWLKKALA
ncbi:MAG: hypothetical protein ACJAYE_003063 [Candidatus Azotimanducaceae bacterium]